uniref:Uncharacterized protein n=1 Tax=Amphimedon queenslandica TaxID=400682 RepID=A0A1X7VET0_AMPQE
MPHNLLAGFLERGICYAFRIGFNRSSQLKSATSHMGLVFEQPEMVSIYIAEEVAAGRLLPATAIQQSPIGIIPKKNKANKFRMIVDLLSPIVQSINDGICKEDYSFHYASVTDTAQSIVACGCGAFDGQVKSKSGVQDGTRSPRGHSPFWH